MGPPPEQKRQKPSMRGVFHAYAACTGLAMGVLLVLEAPDSVSRLCCGIYTFSVVNMFATSATYHMLNWTPEARAFMRRLDHAAIYVLIAGTNTPLARLALNSASCTRLLTLVWAGALLGILKTFAFNRAPKWLAALLYVGLGWVAVPYAGQLGAALGPSGVWLVVGGGVVYSLGALVYAARKPDPWPTVLGYHEIFHLLVALAALLHYVAVYRVVRSPGNGN